VENIRCIQMGLSLRFACCLVEEVKQRMTFRQTWLKDTNNNTGLARYVFLLGTLDNATLQEQLRQESMQFKDIIQFNFVDSYRNITYKSIMGFKWAVQFCSKVKFIFKTDDDVEAGSVSRFDLFKHSPPTAEYNTCSLALTILKALGILI
jgi:beta-1,3-galactosyltransferase 1